MTDDASQKSPKKKPSKRRKRKTPKAKKRNVGRPKLEYNLEEVEKLATLGCTYDEIADFLGCSTRTINRKIQEDAEFCHAHKKGMAKLKVSIRRIQLATAAAGNATMQIWLDKQILGQKDHPIQIESQNQTITHDLTGLGDKELKALESLLGKLDGKSSGGEEDPKKD